MSVMKTNDTEIGYRSAGSGEAIVLVHGSAGSSGQWRATTSVLERAYHVLAPDLHGYGDTPPWRGHGRVSLDDEAGLVSSVMRLAGGPVHLVGHSYGGAVALRVALERPESVRTLTLIEPTSFHLLDGGDAAARRQAAEIRDVARAVANGVLSGDYHAAMATFVNYWNGAGAWTRLRPELRDTLCAQAGTVALNFAAASRERTSSDALSRLAVPTLLMRGGLTREPTATIVDLLAGMLPHVRVETVDEAGHMLPMTHCDAFAHALRRHLASAPSRMPLRVAA